MTTRLPIQLLDDGTPNTLLGRDGAGVITELLLPGQLQSGKGMFLRRNAGTLLEVTPGFRFGTNHQTGTFAGMIKNITSSFVAGNGNGSLDSGTVAPNTFYHVFVIKNMMTSECDILTSLSASSPTLPSNFVVVRRIGSFLVNVDGFIEPFMQIENYFLYGQTFMETTFSHGQGTFYPIITHKIPSGINLIADIQYFAYTTSYNYYVSDGAYDPNAPAQAYYLGANSYIGSFISGGSSVPDRGLILLQNSTGQIRYTLSQTAYGYPGSCVTHFGTSGWYDLEI